MENEANGLADSFVARHTTDLALRLELLSCNQNGSRHDQVTEMVAEIFGSLFALFPQNIRSWIVESLDSTNNSPLALVQGVARATDQMNRVMWEREQWELERLQLRMDQDRRETEITIGGNREMRERERREIRRSSGWREWQEAVPGPWCTCSLDENLRGEGSGKQRILMAQPPYHNTSKCDVCRNKRIRGRPKCRPELRHDERCICLEDAFSGCQILPYSHKVHAECVIAMIQNEVCSCPICRQPLFGSI